MVTNSSIRTSPDLDFLRRVENQLLADVLAAKARFDSRICESQEYARALQRFNDFVLHGITPEDLKSGASAKAG